MFSDETECKCQYRPCRLMEDCGRWVEDEDGRNGSAQLMLIRYVSRYGIAHRIDELRRG